jgi:hypothetical protein
MMSCGMRCCRAPLAAARMMDCVRAVLMIGCSMRRCRAALAVARMVGCGVRGMRSRIVLLAASGRLMR